MATKLKVNYEFVGDSTTPVTRTESIKHGDSMLNTVINAAAATVNTKADKTYVDTELAKKANAADVTTALSGKADNTTVSALDSRVGTAETNIATQTARIDEIASLPEGSTTGDAELIDIRVGADGKTYTSAGNAVRGQISELKSDLITSKTDISDLQGEAFSYTYDNWISHGTLKEGFVDTEGGINTESSVWKHYEFSVSENDIFRIKTYCISIARGCVFLNESGSVISTLPSESGTVEFDAIVPNGCSKMIVNFESDVLTPTITKKVRESASRIDVLEIETNKISEETVSLNNDISELQNEVLSYTYANWASHGILKEGFVDTEGGINTESSVWKHYEFSVSENDIFRIKTYCVSIARGCVFLNESGSVIGTLPSENGTVEFDAVVPNGCSKMIVNFETDILTPTITKKVKDETSRVDDCVNFINQISNTKTFTIDVTNYTTKNGYYLNTNGVEDGFYSSWQYVYFPVKSGETYVIKSGCGYNARLWLILDADKNVLAYSSDGSEIGNKQETVGVTFDNAAYIAVNNEKSYPFSIKEIRTKRELNLSINNNLYGKTIVFCGDSITYGEDMDDSGWTETPSVDMYQWVHSSMSWVKQTGRVRMPYGYQIASRNNMVYYNGGVSGSTAQGMSENWGFSCDNGRYTLLPDEIDYLTLFFGWNDTAYGTLGTINDTTNQSYYGAYNVVMPYLISKYPYTKICLIVPFGCDTEHRNAIRELANKWGVACFDMYQGGTPLYYGKEDSVGVSEAVVVANRAKFQANGAHPNYKGHKQIADMLESFLRGI